MESFIAQVFLKLRPFTIKKQCLVSNLWPSSSWIQFLVVSNVPYIVALPCISTWAIVAAGLIEIVTVDEWIRGVHWSPEALRCTTAVRFCKGGHVVVGVESLCFKTRISDRYKGLPKVSKMN